MRLHDLLHLDPTEPVFLAENSFSDLVENPLTERYLEEFEKTGDADSIQLTEHGVPIAIAVYVHSQGINHWLVLTNIISKDEHFSKRLSGISSSEVIEIDASDLRRAVIEYYSIFLMNGWLCETCAREELPYLDIGAFASARKLLHGDVKDEPDEQNERNERLSNLFHNIGFDFSRADVLEICCGDGSATQVLRGHGCDPICIDYDKCSICDGLRCGQLHEDRSIVLDAAELSVFFKREFDCVIGLMLGPVQPYNEQTWSSILRESVRVVRAGGMLIFTFYTEKELRFAANVLEDCGVLGETFENLPDIGYDRWMYAGHWKRSTL